MFKQIIGISMALLLSGCATQPLVIEHYKDGQLLRKVELDPHFYSRGCASYKVTPAGTVELVVQQDGTSDWIGVRVLPSIAADVVTAALAAVNAPFDIIKALVGVPRPALPEPSAIHGCEGLFDIVAD